MRRVVAGGVLVLGLTGCGLWGSATPAEQRAGGSILLAAPSDPGDVMDAQILGTLTRTDEGCLALASEWGDVYVLQFPFGSELSDDGESVVVPGLGTLREGDRIDGGGGYIDVPDAPEECRISEEFAVWQTVTG